MAARQAGRLEDSELQERFGLAVLGFSEPVLVAGIRELHITGVQLTTGPFCETCP